MEKMSYIPWAKPVYWGNEKEYLNQALESTWISGGAFVDKLEAEFAEFCGSNFAVSSSNGTTSLHLAFLAFGLKPGDEIILPGFCFLAAANVALHMGVKPVFSEVDPDTYCATAETIEPKITPKTRAIIAIHPYGNVCEMDEILALANAHELPVIEDAAESFASRYKGKVAGSMGVMGSFSLHAAKTITTGEGGMVITNSEEFAKKMSLFRSQGLLRKKHYWHEVAGFNFRLTNLQAALGVAQLEHLDQIIAARKRLHQNYRNFLASMDCVRLQKYSDPIDPVLWALALRLDPKAFPQGRDVVIAQMNEKGIETRPGFYPPSQMPHIYSCPPLPACESIASQVISLPSYPSLTTGQVEYISNTLLGLRI